MTGRAAVEAAIVDAHRREWALVVAATVRVARDLELAEECVQEAYVAALQSWTRDGVPDRPAAWLTTTAKRRAMDAVRRDRTFRSKLPLLVELEEPVEDTAADGARCADGGPAERVSDERLRLVFTCCHPVLALDAQVALTLRLMCGVTVPEIARAFIVSAPTMAARITRAKKKITMARIPYRVPPPAELPERLQGVLGVIYLLFTLGHTAPAGDALVRTELVDRSLRLARMLHELMPGESEVRGLLGLVLAVDARRSTRTAADGQLLRLEDQDRSRWDRAAIAEARELISDDLRRGRAGRYVLQAAIALRYAEAPSYGETDWPGILALYDRLLEVWPSPVVALNRAVPLAKVRGAEAALEEVEVLESSGQLTGYRYVPAVKADLLAALGRRPAAAAAYQLALQMATNQTEREFLSARLRMVE